MEKDGTCCTQFNANIIDLLGNYKMSRKCENDMMNKTYNSFCKELARFYFTCISIDMIAIGVRKGF